MDELRANEDVINCARRDSLTRVTLTVNETHLSQIWCQSIDAQVIMQLSLRLKKGFFFPSHTLFPLLFLFQSFLTNILQDRNMNQHNYVVLRKSTMSDFQSNLTE